ALIAVYLNFRHTQLLSNIHLQFSTRCLTCQRLRINIYLVRKELTNMEGDDGREQRGLQIAAIKKLTNKGSVWLVPSQTDSDVRYTVDPDGQWCTCFDHEVRQVKCKHIWAVEFTIKREVAPDGTTTLTQSMRVTYRQDWSAYNAAQSQEKSRFTALLADLC